MTPVKYHRQLDWHNIIGPIGAWEQTFNAGVPKEVLLRSTTQEDKTQRPYFDPDIVFVVIGDRMYTLSEAAALHAVIGRLL